MQNKARAVIIGGGVIGSAIAYYLSRQGRPVMVLEKDDVGSYSSRACDAGITLQTKAPGVHLALGFKSAEMFPALCRELPCEPEYVKNGCMIVVEKPEQLGPIVKFVEQQRRAGLEARILEPEEAIRVQPFLRRDLVAATWTDEDAEVNPFELVLGFVRAARSLGAEFRTGVRVTGLRLKAGRIASVLTTRGEIPASLVVNAGGCFAPEIGDMVGVNIPIVPRRGQLLVTERVPPVVNGRVLGGKYVAIKLDPELAASEDPVEARLGASFSLGHAGDGTLILGNTREFVGFDRSTTPEAINMIAGMFGRMFPPLREITFIRSFAGLRPRTPDGMPIIGEAPGVPGFFIAAGHEGDGVSLAPITGVLVSRLVEGREPDFPVHALGLGRFNKQE